MQKRHQIALPEFDVKYSATLRNAFLLSPLPSWVITEKTTREVIENTDSQLRLHGLKDAEIEQIDRLRYTIFFPAILPIDTLFSTASRWEEMGHLLAYALGIDDRVKNESVAVIYRFIGLILAAKQGLVEKEKVLSHLELCRQSTDHERAQAFMFQKLGQMGLKVRQELKEPHYYKSFSAIRRYNPKMTYRGRDLDEILRELDRSLNYALRKALGIEWVIDRKTRLMLGKIRSHWRRARRDRAITKSEPPISLFVSKAGRHRLHSLRQRSKLGTQVATSPAAPPFFCLGESIL